jgi:hypothetical protein
MLVGNFDEGDLSSLTGRDNYSVLKIKKIILTKKEIKTRCRNIGGIKWWKVVQIYHEVGFSGVYR